MPRNHAFEVVTILLAWGCGPGPAAVAPVAETQKPAAPAAATAIAPSPPMRCPSEDRIRTLTACPSEGPSPTVKEMMLEQYRMLHERSLSAPKFVPANPPPPSLVPRPLTTREETFLGVVRAFACRGVADAAELADERAGAEFATALVYAEARRWEDAIAIFHVVAMMRVPGVSHIAMQRSLETMYLLRDARPDCAEEILARVRLYEATLCGEQAIAPQESCRVLDDIQHDPKFRPPPAGVDDRPPASH